MRMNARQLFGLIVVVLGLAFLAQQLHIWVFGPVVATFWPLIIIVVGLLAWRSNPRQWTWPAMIILVGLILQLQRLGILHFGFWEIFWPLVLVTFGVSLVAGHAGQARGVSSEDMVDLFVAFSGIESKNTSLHFKGGKITSLFGGVKLDLTKAVIADKAELDVFVMFGGAEITVPQGWSVKVGGLPLFGGWEDKTQKHEPGGPLLEVHGTAIFGGAEIKN